VKRTFILVLLSSLLSVNIHAQETGLPTSFLLVKVTDHGKKAAYRLLTQPEYKQLNSEIAAETKFWDKALALCEKAWDADPDTAKKSFPKGAIAQRKALVAETVAAQDKGMERLTEMEKKLKDEEAEEKKRAADRAKSQKSTGNKRGIKPNPKVAENRKKADEMHDALQAKALALFEEKILEASGGQLTGSMLQPEPAPKKEEAKKAEPKKKK
jgi:hypothetical protein